MSATPEEDEERRLRKSTSGLDERLILRLESTISQWKTTPTLIPKAVPERWMASFAGVSIGTFRKWLRTPEEKRGDVLNRLVEAYAVVVDIITEAPVKNLIEIGSDPKNPQAVRALALYLPKADPEIWGDTKAQQTATPDGEGTGVAGLPREVLDDITDDELAQIEAYQREIEERQEATAAIVKRVQARVAARIAGLAV